MSQVRVRLQTGRVELVYEGDEAVFERQIEPILLRLAKDGPRKARPSAKAPSPAEPDVVAKPVDGYVPPAGSFGTFRRQLDPDQNGTESRVTAYAFYLWNYEKKDTFTADEVSGCFRAGGEDLPEDMQDVYAALQDQRILHPGAKEGTWRLTTKGRNRVRKLLV
jgi:hypothetical protein